MKLRKLVKVVAGAVVLVIAVLVAVPFFISADYLKGQLVAQVKAATGRDLLIEGNTSLRLFPNIAVSAEKVTLGNPAGFSAPYFMKFTKLETGAALRPLLAKELRITGVTLVGGVLNLEQNAAGAKNWEFAGAKTAESQPAASEGGDTKKSAGALKALAIGDIVLKDSAVSYLKAGAKPVALEQINLTLRGADGTKALKLDGSALYKKQKVAFTLAAEQMKALMAGKSSPVALSVTVPAASVTFAGKAVNGATPELDGKLSLAVSDLAGLQSWATGKQAAQGPLKKISLDTQVAMKGAEAIALNNLSLALDGLPVTGKLLLNLAGAVPSVRGALDIPSLALDQFSGGKSTGAKEAAAGGSDAAAGNAAGWSDARIDLSALRSVNAALDVTIGKLLSGKVEVRDIAANLALNGGVMKLNLANASLYGGSAKGAVLVDGSGAAAGIGTNLTLSAIEIEPLMVALSGASRLEGKTNLRLMLKTTGASQRALVNALGGNAALEVRDGAFKGINIASFIRDAKKGFLGSGESEKTDFSELSATFQIAQGVVTNNDLSMKSPVLRVAGKGTVSLPPKTVNYRLEPTLVATLKGQGGKDKSGLTIPLMITGPWANPAITPDVAGILEEGLKNPEALKENLQNIKGQIKELNSPKDIGKALFGGKEAAPAAAEASQPAAAGAAPAPAAEPTAKQKRNDAIIQGIGGLLGGAQK